jgi:hypothetical protein
MVAVSTATVSRWSNGKATPDLRTQTVVAELRYVVDRFVDIRPTSGFAILFSHKSQLSPCAGMYPPRLVLRRAQLTGRLGRRWGVLVSGDHSAGHRPDIA